MTKQKHLLRDSGFLSMVVFLSKGLFEIFWSFTHRSNKVSTEKSMHWNTFDMMLNFIQRLYNVSYILLFGRELLFIKTVLQNFKAIPN